MTVDSHHESETVGEKAADHPLHFELCFCVPRSRREGIWGRFGFYILPVAVGPIGKRVEARRRVRGHIICVTKKVDHKDSVGDDISVR